MGINSSDFPLSKSLKKTKKKTKITRNKKKRNNMYKSGYGAKDSTKKGLKSGGRGRNKTKNCRHPVKKRKK